jgi:hypothetical protein
MNKKELDQHWSDEIAKDAKKSAQAPQSSDPRKQKIRRDVQPQRQVSDNSGN